MRGMIPLLVLFVGVMVVTSQSDGTGTTPPSVSTKPTTADKSGKLSGSSSTPSTPGPSSAPSTPGTASAVTSSTFGIVLSVVGVATVRQVL